MENMELLQAMRQMMEEVVSPIYERMDRMEAEFTSLKEEVSSVKEEVASVKEEVASVKEEVSSVKEEVASVKEEVASVKEEVASVKALATKTQITLENDIKPKINLLFEGQITLQNRFSQLDRMEEMLEEVRSDVWALKYIMVGRQSVLKGKPPKRKPTI